MKEKDGGRKEMGRKRKKKTYRDKKGKMKRRR